jgi:hypothetical protein
VVAYADAGPDEDVNHPIPRLDTLDVHLNTERGAYVGIVIASPLRDDPVSRARLQRKVEVSLGFFQSEEYRGEHGAPEHGRSRLWISIHSGSDPAMLELVDHYRAEIEANGVTARVKFVGTN